MKGKALARVVALRRVPEVEQPPADEEPVERVAEREVERALPARSADEGPLGFRIPSIP